jgi:NADH:ubiquinone oxidoreductase subunit F (NADH-binding)
MAGCSRTAFGIPLGELVEPIGGGTASGRPVKAVQVGGPLGAYIHPSQFDLPFDYEAYAAADALIGHGGVTVFDDSADMGAMAQFAMQFCAAESCGKCTPCRIGATRGVELIDRIRSGGGAAARRGRGAAPDAQRAKAGAQPRRDVALLEDLCETMRSASLCALGGFTPYPVMSALKHWPEDFEVRMILGCVPRAVGQSSRFGSDKALAELDGHTLLARAVDALSGWCEHVVVVGRETAPAPTCPTGPRPAWGRWAGSPPRCIWRATKATRPC